MSQTDFQAGLDPTSLASITFAQLLQMINQMSTQYNIGLNIAQPGPSLNSPLAQGVGGAPDVTANPRFSRYTWLNTYLPTQAPTPYTYNTNDGNWYALPISPSTVFDAQVAAGANIQIGKLLAGTARWIVRTNAAGNALEFINPNAIFAAGDVPLTSLDVTGAPGSLSLLQRSAAGVVSWAVLDITSSIAALPITSLANAVVNNYIIQTVNGVPTWVATNNFLTDLDVTLAKINPSGATIGQVPTWNGLVPGNWVPRTPTFFSKITSPDLVLAASSVLLASTAHGLNGVPTQIQTMLVNKAANVAHGYAIGDIIPIEMFSQSNNDGTTHPGKVASVWASITNYGVNGYFSGTGFELMKKNGTGSIFSSQASLILDWNIRVTLAN